MQKLKPLSIIYNEKSGFHAVHKDGFYEEMMTTFTAHHFEIQVFKLSRNVNLEELMQKVKDRHQGRENKGVIVSAGGDGTLNAIASHLLHTNLPLGILPLGTFNYVARALNIPLNLSDAVRVIVEGQPKFLHIAQVNQYIYLNNASLGLYPLFIEKREYYNRLFGRFQFHAYTSALDVLLRNYKELKLEIEIDGCVQPYSTPLIFFGNNQLQLKEMYLRKISNAVEQGKVGAVVVSGSYQWTILKLLAQLVKGEIEHASKVKSFSADVVKVKTCKGQKVPLAIDGELVEAESPLTFSVNKNALQVVVPYATTSL